MTEPPRFPRRQVWAGAAGGVLLLAGVAVGGWELQRATRAEQDRERIEALEATASERADVMDALSEGLDITRGQLEAEGVEPAVPPPEEIAEDTEAARRGEQGEQGERGRRGPGPSDEQVDAAVERWCQVNGCVGQPTAAQVVEALATYCNDRGQCIGPRGGDGRDGTDGTDGAVGSQGPPPSDEQIVAALESYCAAHDGCRGRAGKDGEDSTVPGPRGLAGPTCPGGADPIVWPVDQARSALIGLDPGTYLLCLDN